MTDEEYEQYLDTICSGRMSDLFRSFGAHTYAEAFVVEPPADRLRSLPAWNAVHQRRANVTQPLMPAERMW